MQISKENTIQPNIFQRLREPLPRKNTYHKLENAKLNCKYSNQDVPRHCGIEIRMVGSGTGTSDYSLVVSYLCYMNLGIFIHYIMPFFLSCVKWKHKHVTKGTMTIK